MILSKAFQQHIAKKSPVALKNKFSDQSVNTANPKHAMKSIIRIANIIHLPPLNPILLI